MTSALFVLETSYDSTEAFYILNSAEWGGWLATAVNVTQMILIFSRNQNLVKFAPQPSTEKSSSGWFA